MVQLAAENPGLAKLVVVGQTGRGQDIVALKVTRDARDVEDGARPAMLFSGVNHAREWIAAEVARRMPRWWLEHADDPEVAELLGRNELWFLPIQNPDGYDYTFTCGTGFRSGANEMCGATLVTDPDDPLRGTYVYKTGDGITRCAEGGPAGRVAAEAGQPAVAQDAARQRRQRHPTATTRTASTPTATTRLPGASTRRARAAASAAAPTAARIPLSEPEDLAYDRLLRKITPGVVINYHSAAQLLLYPFGYITDVYADDDPWFKAITGTDGDAAVDPYISQRSSDLYITNGETTDHAYNKYGSMAWTPGARRVRDGGRRHVLRERLRLHVPRRRGQGRGGVPEEPRLRPQRGGDDARSRPARPPAQRDRRRDAVPGQGLAGHRAEPVRRVLRRLRRRSRRPPGGPRRRSTSSSKSRTAPAARSAR